jgi:hypothetical protein
MKTMLLFLSSLALLLAACAPQTAAAASPFALTEDGLFTGSAEAFLLTEAELGGGYVRAFGPVERTNTPSTESPEMEAYHLATGSLSNWVIQFVRPLGSDSADGPDYVTSYATIYSSLEGPAIASSPNWAAELYEAFNTGEAIQWPDSPEIDAEQIIYQSKDGILTVVVHHRNMSFSFLGEGADSQAVYDFLTQLAGAHLERIKAQEQ